MTTERWRRLLLIYTAALLLLGCVLCLLLYRYLGAYEETRPELLMEQLMEENSAEDWLALTEASLADKLSPYEDAAALLAAYLPEEPGAQPLSCRRQLQHSESGDAVFLVRLGRSKLCFVTLRPKADEAARFGRRRWELGGVDAAAMLESLHAVSVEIDMLPGQDVLLNGKALREEALTGSVPVPELSSLERRAGLASSLRRYRVDRMYGEIAVTLDGELLSPEETADALRFSPAEAARRHLTIVAPSDVKVSVGGFELGEDELESRSDGILAGLDSYTKGKGYETLRYTCSLYDELPVTAEDADGTALEPITAKDGTLYFFHANNRSYQSKATEYARQYFSYYIEYGTTGKNYFPLLGRILPKTALYQEIFDSTSAMQWLAPTKAANERWSFDHFHRINDSCFVCTVRYAADMTATDWNGSYSYTMQTLYELCFVRVNDQYYVAAMSTIDL